MKLLITGSNGQLGSEIKELVVQYPNFEFVFTSSLELDICNYAVVNKFIVAQQIDAVINCAAYTAVDKAELEFKKAKQVNSIGVENLVKSMTAVNGKMIHISTDYVFDGENHQPYCEGETVRPIGVYGSTKLNGEKKVLNSEIDGIVIRTSWLYSSFGSNFVKTMLRLGSERNQLGVIFDQVGTPTYARDLALVCLEILSKNTKVSAKSKLYHYSNEGVASWYDFAKAIMEFGNIDCSVSPIESIDYPTPAKRPFYSVLNKSQIKKDFGVRIPYWRDALRDCIDKL